MHSLSRLRRELVLENALRFEISREIQRELKILDQNSATSKRVSASVSFMQM